MKKLSNLIYDDKFPNTCTLDIYLPDKASPCPVFVYFHGGGLEGGRKEDINDLLNLINNDIALVSVNYRMYPQAKFPEFILDTAKAIDYVIRYNKHNSLFSNIFIGGSSAGAYLTMMTYFDNQYLTKYGINKYMIKGWVFDAGQPTVHFNVLRERGIDNRLIRIDEAAPIYFVNQDVNKDEQQDLMFIVSEHDIDGRLEQTNLLLNTMKQFNYDMSKVEYRFMKGYTHCAYPLCDIVTQFIMKVLGE